MAHLLGLRAAVAAGAHLSTYRGAWRGCLWQRSDRLPWPPLPQLVLLNADQLMQHVESSPAVPPEAQRAFRLFAEDLQAAASTLSLWARLITRWAVQVHVRSHEVLQRDLDRFAVTSSPLKAPIFIVGLPRTGTTLLHHLLALDPESQCLRAFELMRPTRPMSSWFPQLMDALDWARLSLLMRIGELIAPQWPHHHSLDANSPEECLFAMQRSMPLDTHYRAEPRLLAVYAAEEEISLAAYQRYRAFLQQVQLRRGSERRRYVLKGQLLHLHFLPQLRAVFPDARVIWLHRPAEQVVGSLCSLRRSQQEVFLRRPHDKLEVGRGALRYLSDALERASGALPKNEELCGGRAHRISDSCVQA
ncbi:unnamed protein product [Effrenium voratum]|nr:unnamed protein product [Effrenium voratum]